MTNPTFNPEDPRLTSFVLGEIDDSDRAEIEQLLETSPEAQAAVKEIEETIGVLKEGLASEPTPELTAEQRAVVEEQLAGGTVTAASETASKRPGARFGKIAGAVASVAVLGIIVTFATPQLEPARDALMAPLNQLSSKSSSPAETVAMAEWENATGFSESFDGPDGDGITLTARPDADRSRTEGARGSLSDDMISAETQSTRPRDEIFSDGDVPRMTLASRVGQLQAEKDKLERQVARSQDGGRSESDFAKRDLAQISQAGDAEKPTSFGSATRSKDVSRAYSQPSDSPQRLIADSGSRPGRNNGQSGSDSFGFDEGRSAPAQGRSVASNESRVDRKGIPQSGDGEAAPAPSTTEASSKLKTMFAQRTSSAAGGKSENGSQSDSRSMRSSTKKNSQPSNPHTRETVVRNRILVAPGDLANPYLIDKSKGRLKGGIVEGGDSGKSSQSPKVASAAAQPESAPAPVNSPQLVSELSDQPVSLYKNQSGLESKKRALQKERSAPSGAGLAGGLALTDRESSSEALKGFTNSPQPEAPVKAVADQTLVVGKELEVLSEQILEEQTRLAAIDRGVTRRVVNGRGFGLEGGTLNEQLRQYSENLSSARSTLEKRPELRMRRSLNFGNEYYEYYAPIVENNFIVPVLGDKEKSLSTISVDVDTASYANMRRFLNRSQLPPAGSVRIEELINYFKYDYPEPEGDEPFSVTTELAQCPWQPSHRLAMVGLKAKTIEKAKRPPTNLVFLLDVSGSMRASNKLPLVQQSMRLLVEEMTEDDRVSIVTYASNAGVRLQSTLGSKKQEILNAINGLRAGGSTNGEGGIRMAYDEANRYYFQGGANRVILCSDGDFNVGKSSDGDLVELIQEKAASGVFLSVFGFGMGNLKDAKLEKLADKGNGHYGYIDNLNEAKKVFQDELVGTLYTVAKDVKLQVEFNPATVGAYRLIGYENRKLAAQDFTDDTKDAGEIGSGHTVTALYEIIPKQVLLAEPKVEGLKYQANAKKPAEEEAGEDSGDKSADAAEPQPVDEELLTVKLRFKKPDEEVSEEVNQEYPIKDVSIAGKQISAVSDDLMFAASVASFGMNLRGSKYRGNWGFAEALEAAQGAQGDGNDAQRSEFIQLVQRAMRITGQQVGPQPRTSQGTTTRPGELGATEARIKASVNGKYRRLVKKIEVRDDFQKFGAFNDYGFWEGSEYAGYKDLPPGNWVYVYPNWYIWAEAVVPPVETKPASELTTPGDDSGKPVENKSAVE